MEHALHEYLLAVYVAAPAGANNYKLLQDWAKDWVNVSAIGYTICTIVITVVAVFQDDLRRWRFRPKYRITVSAGAPWSATLRDEYPLPGGREAYVLGYFLRMKIVNTGSTAAKDVEIFANGIEQWDSKAGQWRPRDFEAMNLVWAYNHQVSAVLPVNIPKYCDLGAIHDPKGRSHFPSIYPPEWQKGDKTILCLACHHKSKSRSYLLRAGKYRLSLTLGSSNSLGLQCCVEFKLSGEWALQDDGEHVCVEKVIPELSLKKTSSFMKRH